MDKNHSIEQQQIKVLFSKPVAVLLLLAILVGIAIGVIGALFQYAITYLTSLRFSLVALFSSEFIFTSYVSMFFISAAMALLGYYLVRRFAREASGSGVQEVEGALSQLRPVRWQRVLPVKFFGGIATLASGMVLGREGPTIQMGANIGGCLADIFRVKISHFRHSLLATGAASGLAVAFNAPLAGIILIIEEMHASFQYTVTSITSVLTGVVSAVVIYRLITGGGAVLFIGQFSDIPISMWWLSLVLGMIAAIIGVIFNATLLQMQTKLKQYQKNKLSRFLFVGASIAGVCGVLTIVQPQVVSSGFNVVHDIASKYFAFNLLMYFFIVRFILSIFCYISGAPGGIFSPLLGLGALLGILFWHICSVFLPMHSMDMGIFIIIGMGALFSASIQAPMTGVILILEMTMNYQLGLFLLIACGSASIIAKFLGGRPLYAVLLERTLGAVEYGSYQEKEQ